MMLISLAAPAIARAQAVTDARVQPELRLDAIVADKRTALQAGGGLQLPVGYYARIGIIGAAGADVVSEGLEASGRLDVVGRFLFDPFRQNRWGLSAGAGVSLRLHAHDRVRPYLLTVIDLEGPQSSGGISPALQLGLGDGIRLGGAMRWGAKSSR
jgi:hypothetical protein